MDTLRVYGPDTIRQSIDIRDVMGAVSTALAAYSAGKSLSPPISFIRLENGGEVHLKSGYAQGAGFFATKIATMVPANRAGGLPTSNGLMLLCSASTGYPVAVLHDRKYLTDIRTAAVGAIATDLLARGDAESLGILGSGGQAVLQARAVALVRPIRQITLWGRSAEHAAAAAGQLRRSLMNVEVSVAASAEEAVRRADILVTATAAREPIVQAAWLRPGVHITALGADDTQKAELTVDCFTRAAFVACDSRTLALRFGEVARGISRGELTAERINGELGDILNGTVAFRRAEDDVTISKHVGIGIEDLYVAEAFYKRAISLDGVSRG